MRVRVRLWVLALTNRASCAIAREVELVCMGSRGLGGVSKALLGSTSSYLLQHAPAGCSILVIKQDGAW